MTVSGPEVGTARGRAPGTRADGAQRPGAGAVVATGLIAAGLVAVVSCLVALTVTGGSPRAAPEGLPDAGAVTAWGLQLVSLMSTLAAVGTVGSLVVAAVLLPARTDGTLGGTARRAASAAGRWAAGWAVLTACELVLMASDVAGVPVTRIGGGAVAEVASTRPGAALCLTAALATVIGISACAAGASTGARVALLVVSVAGLLPGAVAGHASSAPGHDVVVSALVVHVVAVSLWTGGLLGLVLHVRAEPTLLPGAVARFSPLALGAYLALAGSGLIAVAERRASGAAWTSGYGALVVAKAGCARPARGCWGASRTVVGRCGRGSRAGVRDPSSSSPAGSWS